VFLGSTYTPKRLRFGLGATSRVSPLVKGDSRGFVQRELRPPPSPLLTKSYQGEEKKLNSFTSSPSNGEDVNAPALL